MHVSISVSMESYQSELENRQAANVDDGDKVDLCSIEQDRQGEWRYLQCKVSHH